MMKIIILGEGLIGKELFLELKKDKEIDVIHTSRKIESKLMLDLEDNNSVETFDWGNYDVIIDCIGRIDYTNRPDSLEKNLKVNVISPLKIIERLNEKQLYFYLSTHIVNLNTEDHNFYSLSKLLFEQTVQIRGYKNVRLLRIPGIFSENRKSGFIYNLVNSLVNDLEFKLSFNGKRWHIMGVARLAKIIRTIVTSAPKERVINIGYPLHIDPKEIIKNLEISLGKKLNLKVEKYEDDAYIPDLTVMEKYVKLDEEDFYKDIEDCIEKWR
jgi:dTDP-4-dehydrorhamnose reductase